MNDETKTPEASTETGLEQDYVSAIEELKAGSVEKSKYDALQAECSKLIKALANGERPEGSTQPAAKPNMQELRAQMCDLASKGAPNIEVVSKALEMVDAAAELGLPHPFIPSGSQITATAEDYDAAERVTTKLRELVDACGGNNDIFTATLMSQLVDVPVTARRGLR